MKTKILAMKDYHPALGELDRGGDLDWASEKLGGPDAEGELEALKKGLGQVQASARGPLISREYGSW